MIDWISDLLGVTNTQAVLIVIAIIIVISLILLAIFAPQVLAMLGKALAGVGRRIGAAYVQRQKNKKLKGG